MGICWLRNIRWGAGAHRVSGWCTASEPGGQVVGVVSFVAAPMRLGPRDQHLGWDERTRRRNLPKLVSNDRFLVRSGVVVKNLASHVPGLALRRLGLDCQRLNGSAPVAVETCVEQHRRATCYKAAGFECLGETEGLPRGAKEPSRAQRARPDFREPERNRKQVSLLVRYARDAPPYGTLEGHPSNGLPRRLRGAHREWGSRVMMGVSTPSGAPAPVAPPPPRRLPKSVQFSTVIDSRRAQPGRRPWSPGSAKPESSGLARQFAANHRGPHRGAKPENVR